jgi:hypothetical protein
MAMDRSDPILRLPQVGGIARQFGSTPALTEAHEFRRLRARAVEAERRLAIYARRVYALERGVKLAPGQGSAGLDVPPERRIESMAELQEYVEGLYGRMAALEQRLRAAEEGRTKGVTPNLPAVTERNERNEKGVTRNAEGVTGDETAAAARMRRMRERKKAKREGGG